MSKKKNGRHLDGGNGRDLYHRHYCVNCHSRVYPYDTMESLTVAPALGASKHPILLFSFNGYQREKNPDNVSRTAWCWNENKWVLTYRESKFDTQLRYLKRKGIQFRFPNGRIEATPAERTFARVLDQKLEERRVGGGTISVRR